MEYYNSKFNLYNSGLSTLWHAYISSYFLVLDTSASYSVNIKAVEPRARLIIQLTSFPGLFLLEVKLLEKRPGNKAVINDANFIKTFSAFTVWPFYTYLSLDF